jgi:Mn-dependent DtxR family transcriptional regulator
VISQSVACSQHHTIEQRLARLLLTLSGYARAGEFFSSQDSISSLLGVRRVGVSAAAQEFQSAGLIRYRRGQISVLDESGLGKRSCECYRFIRTQYRNLRLDLGQLLAPPPPPRARRK